MDFENQARNFFYAAFICAGFTLGNLAWLIGSHITEKSKSRRITQSLCLFAVTVVFLGAALVQSQGRVEFMKALLFPSVLIGGLSFSAFRFPRAVGFPLLIILGVLAVWFGYSSFSSQPAL